MIADIYDGIKPIPALELPPDAKTDEDRLRCAYRALQRLVTEGQQATKFKTQEHRNGYWDDWKQRALRVQAAINKYRHDPEQITLDTKDKDAARIKAAAFARKMNAREDAYWDTRGLDGHPIFVPKVIPLAEVDPLEDFVANYIELDADSDITVAQHSVTVVTMRRDAESYVSRDMGAGHFVDFNHRFKVTRTAGCPYCGLACTATELDDFKGNTDCAGISMYHNKFYADRWAGGAETCDAANFVAVQDTQYFFDYSRVGSTVLCPIYTGGYGGALIDTVGCDDGGAARRYVFPVNNMWRAAASVASFIVDDLDLQEGSVGSPHWVCDDPDGQFDPIDAAGTFTPSPHGAELKNGTTCHSANLAAKLKECERYKVRAVVTAVTGTPGQLGYSKTIDRDNPTNVTARLTAKRG